jgi:hypothetical protein
VKLDWFDNVSEIVLSISLLPVGQQALGHSSGTDPCFPLAGGFSKLDANGREQSQFLYIHASVSDLYIPLIGLPLLLQKKGGQNLGI